MSDAISTIQLGVGTTDALDHIRQLREGFAGLKSDMAAFSSLGSASDMLKAQTATAANAIEKLAAELKKSRVKLTALKDQMTQLSER